MMKFWYQLISNNLSVIIIILTALSFKYEIYYNLRSEDRYQG